VGLHEVSRRAALSLDYERQRERERERAYDETRARNSFPRNAATFKPDIGTLVAVEGAADNP